MATRRRSSGGSVTGAITDLQRRVKYLQNKPNVTRLANQVVARTAIQPRAVSTDQIDLDAVTNDQVAADAIEREQISVGAVGTREIDNSAVTESKIDNEAVTESKIGQDAVVTDKIQNDAVVNSKIGPFAVNNAKLSDAAVEERNMTPNSVANPTLQTDSVNFRTLDVDAVGNENMLGDSVGNDELQNDSVAQGNMQSDSVGFGEMQSSSVGNSTLQNGAVTDSKIGGTIGGGKIGSGINGGNINGSSIPGNRIEANGITGREIDFNVAGPLVSAGLRTGYGINKSGNTISIDRGDIATNAHRHEFSYGIYTETGGGFDLGGFDIRGGSTSRPQYSSKRFKRNISDHQTESPKKLLELKLKKFQYKKSKSRAQQTARREWMHGYLLEDLIELGFEEVVHYDEEGLPERLDYGLFSTLVLELVKTQQQEIESLKDRVKKMEEK